MEIWEPKPPGTLWATPGLLRDFYSFFLVAWYLSALAMYSYPVPERPNIRSPFQLAAQYEMVRNVDGSYVTLHFHIP